MGKVSSVSLPIFNILSLGQRGVGKTVFLAGCYGELRQAGSPVQDKSLWLDCQNAEDRQTLESILDYIAKTGDYPPPTLKITDFTFTLTHQATSPPQAVSQVRWWDIPGESCDFADPDFQQIVLASQSCCVFINAEKLINDPDYLVSLEKLVNQVIAIANLLKTTDETSHYRFALVFTQCDRLAAGAIGKLQIEEHLSFLITALETAQAQYQRFYTSIPILLDPETPRLAPQGTAAVLLWLSADLVRRFSSQSPQSLAQSLAQEKEPQEKDLQEKDLQEKEPQEKELANPSRVSLPLILGLGLGLLGLAAAGLSLLPHRPRVPVRVSSSQIAIQQYQALLQENPQDFATLTALANLYLEQQQLTKAIPLLEKIVTLRPQDLDWQFNLAKLYELTDQFQKAETVYDRMIAENPQQFNALVGKAQIRIQQGDRTTSQAILKKAAEVAPSAQIKQQLNQQIRTLSEPEVKKP